MSSYAKTKNILTNIQLNTHTHTYIECLNIIKYVKGGGTKNQTKRVAQNTKSIKFSAFQTPRKIQNLFLKRALIPKDYNTCLQIRDFWHDFS